MKGQVSIEYLAVFGFAIVVIIGIVSTFAYLNSNTSQQVPNDCRFTPEIKCIDFKILEKPGNDELWLKFKSVEKDLYNVTFKCSYNGEEGVLMDDVAFLARNQEVQWEPACYLPESVTEGKKVKIEVEIEYHLNLTSKVNYRYFHGTVIGKVASS